MAKFLFATVPVNGHLTLGLPIAERLVGQGHQVVWYSTSKYKEKIESIVAHFYKIQDATDFDDSELDEGALESISA